MKFNKPLESPERGRFLESVQAELMDNLALESVSDALGQDTVDRIKTASDLLTIPNIRNDRAVMPRRQLDAGAIAFVALRRGETVRFDPDDVMPHPRQMDALRKNLEQWQSTESDGTLAVEKSILARMSTRLPESVNMSLSSRDANGNVRNAKGMVLASAAGIRAEEIGLPDAPWGFYVNVRPAVGLAYQRIHNPPAVLLHELVHLDQHLVNPIESQDKNVQKRDGFRRELEAYHHEAHYVSALSPASNKLVDLWRQTQTATHTEVERIRSEFADPNQPFEPTPDLVGALKEAGYSWAQGL